MAWKACIALAAVVCIGAGQAGAALFLLSNGQRTLGLAGAAMAGAQVALTRGAEAAWYNPAGMAREERTEALLDGALLESSAWTSAGQTSERLDSGPVSFAWASGPRRGRPRLAFGFFVHTPTANSGEIVVSDQRTVTNSALPPPVRGAVDYDALFPQGVTRTESSQGVARLDVLAVGGGLGLRVADWMRMGLNLRVERVQLAAREQVSLGYRATGDYAGGSSLSGSSQYAAAYAGVADRAVASLGVQVDLASGIALGIVAQSASDHIGGRGSAQVDRADHLTLTIPGTPGSEAAAVVHADGQALPFDLRSPLQWRVGLSFVFDTVAAEFDVERAEPLASYAMFPRLLSTPPSTAAQRLGSLTTAENAVTRYALGVAFAQGNTGTLMLGLRMDPASAVGGDPLFARLDLYRMSTGYYFTRGAASGGVHLSYSTGFDPALSLPSPAGAPTAARSVEIAQWALGLGAAMVF